MLYRTRPYLLAPAAPYELQGDVPNVVFPCASLQDGDKVAVYYGAADTVVGMAFGYISEIIEFTKKKQHCIVNPLKNQSTMKRILLAYTLSAFVCFRRLPEVERGLYL